jgi:hypothetical protein
MDSALSNIARWGALALVAGFSLVVLMNLLTGRVRLNGLLSGVRADGRRYSSYGRAQLLAVSLFTAGLYLARLFQNPSQLPAISNIVIALFGASGGIYAGEKAWAMLFSRSTSSARRTV